MIIPPKLTYNGLTIVMSNQSRFDIQDNTLLSRFAGKYVNRALLASQSSLYKCELRTLDTVKTYTDLRPGTKAILALGNRALQFFANTTDELVLDQQRGAPIRWQQKVNVIASYLPQDCFDRRDYEGMHNEQAEARWLGKDGEDLTDTGKGRKMNTRPHNYKFWLWRDITKALTISNNNGLIPTPRFARPKSNIYPAPAEVCKLLTETKGQYLNLDIENDNNYNLYCVGFSFNSDCVYVVPIVRWDYTHAYSQMDCAKILRSLAVAMRDNTVVVHNSQYDLWVLANRYSLPIGRQAYDTMLSQHKCFVDVERSLGHCISYWLYEPYHKDDATYQPANARQERALWEYNALDVAALNAIRVEQMEYAKGVKGLTESIQQSNDCIYPYLLNSLVGMRYNREAVDKLTSENDTKMNQLLRMIRLLTGGVELLPSSNKQCVEYFHDKLGYKPVAVSPRTKQPSLAKEALYKLKLKYPDNALIDVCIEYRRLQTETGSLGFVPWRE